ncbi:hypothetical protein CEY16_00355 [Halalkalibacillus sediminis]|uniref:YhcN/YlaJ family sporulation lipoprotein n=1 Tax=Halalkalibacillus sediminis TaxID=2018042 RepID=A0A2I0QV86_9BACI|nr:YhcN/YlaJ family sporulation lipoprotein [Halalkalibacillus sediminis]PKR78245.1 hypothetical protein CEY16_00355 [Halalkalibacillus sediminis]
MRLFMFAIVITFGMTLVACQGDEMGINPENGTDDYQQTRYGDQNMGDQNMGDPRDDGGRLGINRMQNDENNNDLGGNNNGRYEMADRVADRINNDVEEVDNSYVMTGENNAYVAVNLRDNDSDEVNDQIKDKISNIVKRTDSDIENVYVSANPDFLGMVDDYAGRVQNGDPVEGFFDEFNDMFDRIFPDRDGTE